MTPAHRTATTPRRSFYLSGLAAGFCLLGFFAVNDSSFRIASGALACIACTVGMYFWTRHYCPNSLILRVILLISGSQLLVLFVFGALRVPPILYSNALQPDLTQAPGRAVFPLILPCIAAAAVAWLMRHSRVLHDPSRSAHELLTANKNLTAALLLLGIGLLAGFYLGFYLPNTFGYFFRVAWFSTPLMPFFAGRCYRRFPRIAALWVIALLINCGVATAIGGRSLAFVPPVLFAVGALSISSRRMRWAIALISVPAIVPAFAFFGALGLARGELGRDSKDLVNLASLQTRVQTAFELANSEDSIVRNQVFFDGPGRLVAWPNSVVCALTPEVLPYRGLGTMPREIIGSLQLFGFLKDPYGTTEELQGGNLAANEYGFMVNEDTSVEFGIVADGWSRAGPVAVFTFSLVFCLLGVALECTSLAAFFLPPAFRLMLVVVCGSMGLGVSNYSFIDLSRGLILNFFFWLLILALPGRFVMLSAKDAPQAAVI
jgi:hypothetical protein